jgi:hypothetical protein
MGIISLLDRFDDVRGGVTNGAYRQAPWHGLGESKNSKGEVVGRKLQIVGDPRTADEIMDLGDYRWAVTPKLLSELGLTLGGADKVKLIVRDDTQTILGVHSEKYGELQNDVGAGFVEEILRTRSDAQLMSTTELFGGEIIFAVIDFHDGVQVTRRNGEKTDQHTRHMGVYWSHNGQYPLGVKYINHEWVCRNTFTPWNAKTGIVVRHTRNAADIAANALLAVEGMMTAFDAFDLEVERLIQTEATKQTLTKVVIPTVLGTRPEKDGRSQTMYDTAFNGIVAEWGEFTSAETAFDAVMAVQGYEQHRKTVRNNPRDVATIRRLLRDDFPMTAAAAGVFAPLALA